MKRKKLLLLIILPVIAITLEALPFGAVLFFAPSPTERIKNTFSYFSLTPFGYANFGPLLTAVLSCALLLVSLFVFIKKSRTAMNVLVTLSVVAILTSCMPLSFGVGCFSLVGVCISIVITAEMILALIMKKRV